MTLTTHHRTQAIETGVRVGRLVTRLQNQYTQSDPTSYSRRVLAELRRSVGRSAEECVDLLLYVADPTAPTAPGDPEGDEPTPGERAALAALGLYALHQQSGTVPMHRGRVSFGRACGRIKGPTDNENAGVLRRFRALGTVDTLEELTHHSRGLIQLMRSADVGIDYGQFATDLHLFQDPDSRDGVRLRWGRDFYRLERRTPESAHAATNSEPDDGTAAVAES